MKERADKNAAWASFHKANALTGGRFKLLPSDLCGPCGALKIPYAVEGVEDPLFTPHLPLPKTSGTYSFWKRCGGAIEGG